MRIIAVPITVLVLTAGALGAAAHEDAHAQGTHHSPIVSTTRITCVQQTHANGNVTVNDCRTMPRKTWWMKKGCSNANAFNCYTPKPGDGGEHAHYRYADGDLACVFFTGARRYAKGHDYCIQN